MNTEHDPIPDSNRSGDEDSAQNGGSPAGRAWRAYLLPLLLLIVLVAIVISRLNSRSQSVDGEADGVFAVSPSGESIDLEIDFGDGAVWRYSPIPWKEGMTVADALDRVKKHRHGVQYRFEGEGEKAMLYRIEGAQNQGGATGAKNWVYEVNGKRATVGFAVCPLEATDTVLWKFTVYDYNKPAETAE